MVRQVADARTPGWKAVLAVSVAGAALLWHVLACTESPMAFSPSGKDLAFVVMTPYDLKDLHLLGGHTYRLMVARQGKKARIVEQTDRHMLTAPAFSPDGKCLAYLRIPLMTKEDADKLGEKTAQRAKLLEEKLVYPLGGRPADTQPADEAGETKDLALPAIQRVAEFYKNALSTPLVPVELVVRDAMATEVVMATVTIELPVLATSMQDSSGGLVYTYLLTRPQYSPDGQWIHFCLGSIAAAVNPKTAAKRLLAAPATVSVLSPDGKTLATAYDRDITFVRTDGSRKAAIRWEGDLSASGIVWADNKTLALLVPDDKQAEIRFLQTDGNVIRTFAVPKPQRKSEQSSGELALAPDRKHIVIAYGKEVHFLDAAGGLLNRWQGERAELSQPTFTPDGKRVAFRRLREGGVQEIVYFSPDGHEIPDAKVALPKLAPPAEDAATR